MNFADQRDEKRRTRPRFVHENARTTDKKEWVVWNGSMGILVMAAIGRIEDGAGGRQAFLAPPYDVVGPFSLDELETRGRIAFGACLVTVSYTHLTLPTKRIV